MDGEFVLAAGFAVFYAAGSVWFYLHCVRPALLWNRARRAAHVLLAVVSVLPATAIVLAAARPTVAFTSALTWIILVTTWVAPRFAIRATGGPTPVKGGVDEAIGWLSPAAGYLDVGDVEAAQAQVSEARRHATPESAAYVDHWDSLVREEVQRRNGERISRLERLKAIQNEYARLILGADPMSPFWEALIVVAVGAVVLASIISRALP